ncbi:MAG: hypothetical protein Q9195_004611 [Heterodermia aff. obscurata]
MFMESHKPILIIGGGIAGLALAQGLRKKHIPFLLFERDASAQCRPQGWALTIHFSLTRLLELLPDDIACRLHTCKLDQSAKQDQSPSIFLNLEDCTAKWRLPPTYGNRMRVARTRLRGLLLEELDDNILWGKSLVSFDVLPDGVRARFTDGSWYDGELLVGVDGCHSQVRSLLYGPQLSRMTPIPGAFLGTQALATDKQVGPLVELDPTLFQGCHPSAPIWMWFSIMEKAQIPDHSTTESLWRVQICLSWLSLTSDVEIPGTNTDRVRVMRQKSSVFHPRLKNIFQNILRSDQEPIVNIPLEFWWLPEEAKQLHTGGRVTLAGDAAHSMPFYRGEGFNHALADVYLLLQSIDLIRMNAAKREAIIEAYEAENRSRGRRAALMCRDACLEVHHWDTLGDHSVVRQKSVPLGALAVT